ncbi:UPF0149 family protein [Beggiatoa leptomitoformis]|uniref:UPF0149 family protein n=1 Tax=Beggiatoa leptomitoformis TaxID=288004 RepID=A0A2N9YJQ1_9GAMM|nr:UPF0149 family protein [Beggiatoa leptomitoformis]ALG69316.2 UPF0149 family protein [Beggiatoa leptomitoformis]AUI70496.2 UPF0149 family protein [Beggiatoa leptomitoformis]
MKQNLYQPLNQSLQHAGALMDIAEAHGILTSMLCAAPHLSHDIWLKHILGETAGRDLLADESRQQLIALHEYTQHQLASNHFEFTPLLPSDDEPLYLRTQSLGGWCEGFVFGLGLAGIKSMQQLTEEIQEFIRDVVNISHLAPIAENTEEDEVAYAELIEYIRVGVSTFYEAIEETTATEN